MRAGIPDLRGAACRGHPELFGVADRHDTQAITAAKAVCIACPALRDCRRRLARPAKAGAAVRCRRAPLRPTAQAAARPTNRGREHRPAGDRATDWLRGYLAQRGPVVSTRVIADATAAGISLSTLRKARIDLNVRLQRVSGVGARHTWICCGSINQSGVWAAICPLTCEA